MAVCVCVGAWCVRGVKQRMCARTRVNQENAEAGLHFEVCLCVRTWARGRAGAWALVCACARAFACVCTRAPVCVHARSCVCDQQHVEDGPHDEEDRARRLRRHLVRVILRAIMPLLMFYVILLLCSVVLCDVIIMFCRVV